MKIGDVVITTMYGDGTKRHRYGVVTGKYNRTMLTMNVRFTDRNYDIAVYKPHIRKVTDPRTIAKVLACIALEMDYESG